jgi:hypothetical protein
VSPRGRRQEPRSASAVRPAIETELAWLLRAGVTTRAVRLTVRQALVQRIERGPLDATDVTEAVESVVRAACRLVRELDAPDDLIETVCRAALESVRGHGGQSARWLVEVRDVVDAVLDEMAREDAEARRWLAWRGEREWAR